MKGQVVFVDEATKSAKDEDASACFKAAFGIGLIVDGGGAADEKVFGGAA